MKKKPKRTGTKKKNNKKNTEQRTSRFVRDSSKLNDAELNCKGKIDFKGGVMLSTTKNRTTFNSTYIEKSGEI